MRRFLAAAGAAVVSIAVVVPVARAVTPDSQHKLDWWTPVKYDQNGNPQPQPSTAPDGASVYSTDEVITAKADFVDGVKSWDVRLQPTSGGPASTCHEDIAPDGSGNYPQIVYMNCPWDTTRVVDRTLDQPTPAGVVGDQNLQRNWHLNDHGASANGKYDIQVTVVNAGRPAGLLTSGIQGDQQFTLYQPNTNPARWREVWVTNDVSAPTGVAAAYDAGAGRIHVTWAPNPEPDVSYVVQEKVGSGQWSSGAAVPGNATSYDRAVDQPGNYQYRVAAVRPAPTSDSGGGASATKRSDYVAAQAVQINQVTPPTTAGGVNGPDGTIDHSGDAGVLLPTDPTAPGAAPSGPGGPNGTPAGGRSSGGLPGSHVSTPANRPTGSTAAGGGEAEGEGPDEGFSSTLPYYQAQDGSTDGLGNGDEEPASMSPLVNVPRPRDTRAVLIPLAGGLAMFVLAMQVTVLIRRRPAMATAEDDFDDWLGF
jgi:hypothetical protein